MKAPLWEVALRAGIFFFTLLLFPFDAYANSGILFIPTVFLTVPAMVCALIPVIIIEALCFFRYLKLRFSRAVGISALANVVSTVLGGPLAWLGMLCVFKISGTVMTELVTRQVVWPSEASRKALVTALGAAFLREPPPGDEWTLSFAVLVFLVPNFFISYWMEKFIVFRTLRNTDRRETGNIVWRANLFTYGGLALLVLVLRLYCTCFDYAGISSEPVPVFQRIFFCPLD